MSAQGKLHMYFSEHVADLLSNIMNKTGTRNLHDAARLAIKGYEWITDLDPESTIKVFDKNGQLIESFKVKLLR